MAKGKFFSLYALRALLSSISAAWSGLSWAPAGAAANPRMRQTSNQQRGATGVFILMIFLAGGVEEGERPEGDTVVWRDLLVDRLDVREQLRVPVRILPTRDQGGNE